MSKTTKTRPARRTSKTRMSKSATRAEGAARADRLRETAVTEINARTQTSAAPKMAAGAKGTRSGKASKNAKETKPKRVSALDAAAQVLAKAKKPMNVKELIEAIAAAGLWTSPGGKTPQATLYAAMFREIKTKGKAARFRKVERGTFEATGR